MLKQLVGAFGGMSFCSKVFRAHLGVLLELHEARTYVVEVEVCTTLGVSVLRARVVLEVDAFVVVEVLIFVFRVFLVRRVVVRKQFYVELFVV